LSDRVFLQAEPVIGKPAAGGERCVEYLFRQQTRAVTDDTKDWGPKISVTPCSEFANTVKEDAQTLRLRWQPADRAVEKPRDGRPVSVPMRAALIEQKAVYADARNQRVPEGILGQSQKPG
jgi:hypothetical protein